MPMTRRVRRWGHTSRWLCVPRRAAPLSKHRRLGMWWPEHPWVILRWIIIYAAFRGQCKRVKENSAVPYHPILMHFGKLIRHSVQQEVQVIREFDLDGGVLFRVLCWLWLSYRWELHGVHRSRVQAFRVLLLLPHNWWVLVSFSLLSPKCFDLGFDLPPSGGEFGLVADSIQLLSSDQCFINLGLLGGEDQPFLKASLNSKTVIYQWWFEFCYLLELLLLSLCHDELLSCCEF